MVLQRRKLSELGFLKRFGRLFFCSASVAAFVSTFTQKASNAGKLLRRKLSEFLIDAMLP